MNNSTVVSRFRKWLTNIPIEDPINRRMAALLQLLLMGLIGIVLLSTFINLFLVSDDFPWQEAISQALIVGAAFGIPLILLRRGYFRTSVSCIIAVFLIVVTASIIGTNLRAKADSLIFFTLAILMAGLLVGRRALIVTFAVSAGIIALITFRESDPALKLDYITITGNFILLNGLMSMFVDSFGATLRNALRLSLQREDDLKKEIARRALVEEKVNALNQEMQGQIAELERFTYTVSHDLRTPLVTIKGFVGMLKKDIQENHPDRVEQDMQRIAGATDKMDALLSELLELSRIGRVVNPFEEIELSSLVQDALELMDGRIRSSNVKVDVAADLPVLYGDRVRLLEVFENLIDNAIKYMGDQPEPLIEIGVRDTAGQQVIFVKDNGIGVEERYHARIFGLFEKLDPTIDGTGIGLALVKRIIETHGGWVWVESEGLGKGSAFCFTIPDGRP